jgi:hypothetical protein
MKHEPKSVVLRGDTKARIDNIRKRIADTDGDGRTLTRDAIIAKALSTSDWVRVIEASK